MNTRNTNAQTDTDESFENDGLEGTNVNNEMHEDLALASLSLEQLQAEAVKRGIQIKATDKSGIIEELIAATVASPSKAEVGTLISMHTRDEAAVSTIRAIRNKQTENLKQKKTYTIWLRNREGTMYSMQNVTGCPLSRARMDDVLHCLSPLPDGSQNALIEEFKAKPDNFEVPLLVRLKRKGKDENGPGQWYVMLYIERKVDQKKLVEQSF